MIKPNKDGIDHINIYSKGKTELGRFLTNFSYSPIITEDGEFNSIEGYWYWLGSKDESLRKLYGFKAKQKGREVKAPDWIETKEFKEKILKAIDFKIQNNPKFLKQLIECELPLKHYYVYGSKVVEPKQGKWILEHLEKYKGNHPCDDCGTLNNVEYTIDPYIEEIHDKQIHKYLCKECYKESCLDI